MEEKAKETGESSALYYGIGAAVLVLLVAGIYLMRPKTTPTTSPVSQSGATGGPLVKPTTPINGLACELQYYNPVLGFKKYYLSAEGSDVVSAKTVDCDFDVSVTSKNVTKASVKNVALVDEPTRSGKTFRCTTEGLELEPNVPTTVDVAIKDNEKNTASCSATFLFPTP